jgi:hypothetical protein
MNHLAGVSEQRVRESFVEGLETLRKQRGSIAFDYYDVIGQVARVVIPVKAAEALAAWQTSTQRSFKTNPNSVEEHPDTRKLLSALWSLVGQGLLLPRLKNEGDVSVIYRVSLTEAGERVVSKGDEHPRHPGFIKRFRAAAPTATGAVVAHLEDALSCLEADVLRPALMMLGLANEVTIRITHAALAHQTKVSAAGPMAKARDLLADIDGVAKAWAGGKGGGVKDEEHRLKLAAGTLEAIRDERNNAAHPGRKVTDGAHVEGLLMLGAQHLPVLWEVMVKPAVVAGFVP